MSANNITLLTADLVKPNAKWRRGLSRQPERLASSSMLHRFQRPVFEIIVRQAH
jgi:hypothetical protein